MRLRVPEFRARTAALAGFALLLACASFAQAPSSASNPPPIPAPSTNRPSLTPRAEALRRLEEELSRVLKPLTPKSSVDGVMAPSYHPPARAIPNRQTVEKAERRKDWGLLTPEEVAGFEEAERLFAPFDQKNDSLERNRKRSPEEEFLFSNGSRSGKSEDIGLMNPFAEKDSREPKYKSDSDEKPEDDSRVPEALRNSQRKLEEMARPEAEDNYFGKSVLKDTFGNIYDRDDPRKTFLEDRDAMAHKAYMDEYRQVLHGSSPSATVPTVPGVNPSLTTPTVSAVPSSGLMPSGFSSALGSSLAPANPNPVFRPSTPQEVNAQVLNRWNPTYTTPRIEPPQPVVRQTPSFEAPRRKF